MQLNLKAVVKDGKIIIYFKFTRIMATYRGKSVKLNKVQRGRSKKILCICERWKQSQKGFFWIENNENS